MSARENILKQVVVGNAPTNIVKVESSEALTIEDYYKVSSNADKDQLSEAIESVNKEYFISSEGGRTGLHREITDAEFDIKRVVRVRNEDFYLQYANRVVSVIDAAGNSKTVPLAKAWMASPNRREYLGGMVFAPNGQTKSGEYNLWQGFGITPISGDPSPMLKHILNVICSGNKVYAMYVICWCARAVQFPDKVGEVSIVMRSKKGTGKSTLGRIMKKIFASHGLQITNSKHLTGNFNGHLRATLFLFADEAFFAGDRAGESVLKGLITESTIAIESKGADVIQVRNRLKVMMASNSDWVIPASADERRYFVLEVSDKRIGDTEYFESLNKWLENGGEGIWLDYLLKLDISDFDVRKIPPTKALDNQKIQSFDPLQAWIYSKLHEADWQSSWPKDNLVSTFSEYVRANSIRHVKTDATSVGKRLHNMFPSMVAGRRGAGGKTKIWIFPDIAQARSEFANYAGIKNSDWPDD